MSKKEYTKAEIEVIKFIGADVVAASATELPTSEDDETEILTLF